MKIESGMRFSRLVAIQLMVKGSKRVKEEWLCVCDCGEKRSVRSHSLRTGHTKSCGCLQREIVTQGGRLKIEHGHARSSGVARPTPTWSSWNSMIRRCNDKNARDYHLWGGRGITICDRWGNFSAFLEDMGVRPAGTTLDRIDNEKNYEPGNCRWATKQEQGRNRRDNIVVEHEGRAATLAEWSEVTGIAYATLNRRYHRGKLGSELFAPPLPWNRIRGASKDVKVLI